MKNVVICSEILYLQRKKQLDINYQFMFVVQINTTLIQLFFIHFTRSLERYRHVSWSYIKFLQSLVIVLCCPQNLGEEDVKLQLLKCA